MGGIRTALYAQKNKAGENERLEARKESKRIEVLEKNRGYGTRNTAWVFAFNRRITISIA